MVGVLRTLPPKTAAVFPPPLVWGEFEASNLSYLVSFDDDDENWFQFFDSQSSHKHGAILFIKGGFRPRTESNICVVFHVSLAWEYAQGNLILTHLPLLLDICKSFCYFWELCPILISIKRSVNDNCILREQSFSASVQRRRHRWNRSEIKRALLFFYSRIKFQGCQKMEIRLVHNFILRRLLPLTIRIERWATRVSKTNLAPSVTPASNLSPQGSRNIITTPYLLILLPTWCFTAKTR